MKRRWLTPLNKTALQHILEENPVDDTDSDLDYQPSPKRSRWKLPSSVDLGLQRLPDGPAENCAFQPSSRPTSSYQKTSVDLQRLPKEDSLTESGAAQPSLTRNNQKASVCRSLFEHPDSLQLPIQNNNVVTYLESQLQEYEKQLLAAKINGLKSTMKRKAHRVSMYRELILKAKKGESLNVNNLPDPFSSPAPKKINVDVRACSSTENQVLESDIFDGIQSTEVVESENETAVAKKKKNTKMGRKENFCFLCQKLIKQFCKHFEVVHRETEEGKLLNELNKIEDIFKRKLEKTKITDKLRKQGNAEYSKILAHEDFILGKNASVIPVKRSSKSDFDQTNSVQCAHCSGFYRRRKFSQHLRHCKYYLESLPEKSLVEGNVEALKAHSVPVINEITGASEPLMDEVLKIMKPKVTKDVAMRDSLIMRYATEFHKTRRAVFQRIYVSRVITDLARILIRVQEKVPAIKCLEDIFNPAYFSVLIKCILDEGGYNERSGEVKICGLANRYRSHIKAAAETAQKQALVDHYSGSTEALNKRKKLKHFLCMLKEKWANEVGRIFDMAVKQSRSENEPKLAAESDIVKTCQFISSQYRSVMKQLNSGVSGSLEKQKAYNKLLDLLISHIMCLIRRRPVDFKRATNIHYEKMDIQEDLISEIKNSKHMKLSEDDLALCDKFKVFYIPGKGYKELVPIALTNLMKEAMDAVQTNKKDVGIVSNILFVRAKDMPINPRECLRKVTQHLKLKKPLDLSGNGLRHHAGTFSKLHSSHPNYQDYLASALGHTLHIHRLHYEMPTSIIQKLIVCPVLHGMTQPSSQDDRKEHQAEMQAVTHESESLEDLQTQPTTSTAEETPENVVFEEISGSDYKSEVSSDDMKPKKKKKILRRKWSEEEKSLIYETFGQDILDKNLPKRQDILKFFSDNKRIFHSRTLQSLVTFMHNKCTRKQKLVTPEVKRFFKTHRKITNVPV